MTDWNLIASELSRRPSLTYTDKSGEKTTSLAEDSFNVNQNIKPAKDTRANNPYWRPAVMNYRLGGTASIEKEDRAEPTSKQPSVDSPKQIEPEATGEIKAEEVKGKQPLVHFEVFDGSGRQEDVESSQKPTGFDQSVEGFAEQSTSKPEEPIQATKVVNQPTAGVNDNQARAEQALAKPPEIVSANVAKNRPLAVNPPENSQGVGKDVETEDGGGQADFENIAQGQGSTNEQKPEATTPLEQPEVTVTNVEPALGQNELATDGKLAAPDDVTISAEPTKTADANEHNVPITINRTARKEVGENNQGNYQPVGETRMPEEKNGVDDQVAAIQERIRAGSEKIDQEIDADRAARQEAAIAPAPEEPGDQVPSGQKPEVHIDGQKDDKQPKAINPVRPKQDFVSGEGEKLDAHDYALKIGPEATANQFAELLNRRRNRLGDEQLKRAA